MKGPEGIEQEGNVHGHGQRPITFRRLLVAKTPQTLYNGAMARKGQDLKGK